MSQQRILIVLEDGAFKGASQQDGSQSPQPLSLAELGALLPSVEIAAIAEIDRLKSQHAAEIAELQGQPRPTGGVTKLTIKRRLDALGPEKWPTLKAALSTFPESLQDEWTLAQEIRFDDPMFESNAAAFKVLLDLTDEQFTALLTP